MEFQSRKLSWEGTVKNMKPEKSNLHSQMEIVKPRSFILKNLIIKSIGTAHPGKFSPG